MTEAAPLAQVEDWLAKRRHLVLGAILGLAVLVRILVFFELADTPVPYSYRYGQMDMNYFDGWAGHICHKDAVGRESTHPVHLWHERIAVAYFDRHPELIGGKTFSELQPREGRQHVSRLWNRWYGETRFHQEPLYPYLIALVYWFDQDPFLVYVMQMLGGVLTIGLLFGVSRRLFGDLVATLAALVAVFWGPMIHYEFTLLRTSFIILAGMAILHCAQRLSESIRANRAPRFLALFAFGSLIGVSTALKSTFLPFSLGLFALLFWPMRRESRSLLRSAGAVSLGVLLVLSPIVLRNYAVDAPLFSLTSVGAVTFAGANTPGYLPPLGWYPFNESSTLSQILEASDGKFWPTVFETLAAHDSLGSWIGKLWWKFELVWHWFELPNNVNFYFSCLYSTVLTTMRYTVAVWWVMPAALVGIFLALRRRRPVGAWVWYMICCILPMVVLYVLSRFRAPMVLAMMPFAAYAIVEFIQWCATRRWFPAGGALVFCVAMAFYMNRSWRVNRPVIDPSNYLMAMNYYYRPLVERARRMHNPLLGAQILEAAIEREPSYLRKLSADNPPADIYQCNIAMVFGEAYDQCATAYKAAGVHDRATHYAERFARSERSVEVWKAKHKAENPTKNPEKIP